MNMNKIIKQISLIAIIILFASISVMAQDNTYIDAMKIEIKRVMYSLKI